MRGAREHNLKDITVELPRDRLVVITGLSGSGKSSLAFDTIYAEGQRRYVESLSAYARQFLGQMEKPDVDQIDGLSPAISIDQKGASRNPRSTVGTVTEIYDHMRLLFARVGHPHCPRVRARDRATESAADRRPHRLLARRRSACWSSARSSRTARPRAIGSSKRRASRASCGSEWTVSCYELDQAPSLDKYKRHTIEVVVDRLVVRRADDDGRPFGPEHPDPDAGPTGRLHRDRAAPGRGRRGRGAGRPGHLRGAALQRALQLPLRWDHHRGPRAPQLQLQLARTALARTAPASACAWRSTSTASCPTGRCRSPTEP